MGIFALTIIFVFLTIFVESINLILQLKGRKLTKWFGKNAFNLHMISTDSFILRYIGLILLISGTILALWAFRLLGLKRSLCLNFFEENVPIVKKSLYKYIKNPEDFGLWMALVGLAIFTGSIYNLVVALEFIILMIPHMILENKPLKEKVIDEKK